MTKVLIASPWIGILLLLASCSNSSSPDPGNGQFQLRTTITTSVINAISNDRRVETLASDSVRIDSLRLLISRVTLLRSSDDTSGIDAGRIVHGGPAVITWKQGAHTTAFASEVPAGSYRAVKLELHRFSASEIPNYRDDPMFHDFCEPERVTVIVNGLRYENGLEEPFQLTLAITRNIWIIPYENFDIQEGAVNNFYLDLDGALIFKSGGRFVNSDSDTLRQSLVTALGNLFKAKFR